MVLQAGQGVAVQEIAGHGVAHQIEPPLAVLPLLEALLRVGDRAALQVADKIAVNAADLGQIHGVVALLRAQGASRSGHAHPPQAAAQLLLHPLRDPAGHLGHLTDILDLAVQHGAAAMLLLLDGQHLQALVHHPARYADDAACADIQGEYQLRVLLFQFLGHSFTSVSCVVECS